MPLFLTRSGLRDVGDPSEWCLILSPTSSAEHSEYMAGVGEMPPDQTAGGRAAHAQLSGLQTPLEAVVFTRVESARLGGLGSFPSSFSPFLL